MMRFFQGSGTLFKPLTEIYENINENRQFNAVYLLMLVLAALIALLGLLLNSPAVIIGAMLISPLMFPILSCGLALTLADWDLGKKGLRNVGFSVAEAILITALAAAFAPLKDATPEILARSNPNIMDLLVAIFSGVAGTLALCSRTVGSTILPGVAIATAVMPPLAVVGFGLSTGQFQIARGAFMLFVTNLTAIVIAADVVFLLIGFRPQQELGGEKQRLLVRYRMIGALLILAVISIPLVRTLMRGAQQATLRKTITTTLNESVRSIERANLASVDFATNQGVLVVDAYVRTSRYINLEQVEQMQRTLAQRTGQPVKLNIQQVRMQPGGASEAMETGGAGDFLGAGVVRPLSGRAERLPASEVLASIHRDVEEALRNVVQPMEIQELEVRSITRQPDDTIAVEISGREPRPTGATSWAVAAAATARQIGAPVRLHGRITIAEDAVVEFAEEASTVPLRVARALEASLRIAGTRDDLRVAFSASDKADAQLTAKRLAWLAERIKVAGTEGVSFSSEMPPDSVRVLLIQLVDASGRPTPASPPAPKEEAAPAASAPAGP